MPGLAPDVREPVTVFLVLDLDLVLDCFLPRWARKAKTKDKIEDEIEIEDEHEKKRFGRGAYNRECCPATPAAGRRPEGQISGSSPSG